MTWFATPNLSRMNEGFQSFDPGPIHASLLPMGIQSLSTMNSLRNQLSKAICSSRQMWPRAAHLQIRNFHQTKPTHSPATAALDAATGFLYVVHDCSGLSWALSIPLTAIIVRTVVGFPLQLITRGHARRAKDLQPLLASYKSWENKVKQEDNTEYWKGVIAQTSLYMPGILRKKYNVNPWAPAISLLQIPVWFALIEGLRGMSGMGAGLFATLFSLSRTPEEPKVPEGTTDAVDTLTEPSITVDNMLSSLTTSTQGTADVVNTLIEPSFATEGALWFPDLLAGDPTGILPVTLTASMLLNIGLGWKAPDISRYEIADLPTMQMYYTLTTNGLRKFLQVLAFYVGFSAYVAGMPTAVLLYWITSTNIATAQSFFLNKFMYKQPSLKSYVPKYTAFMQWKGDQAWNVKRN